MSTSSRREEEVAGEDEGPPRPFGFRTIVVLTAIYLGYRLVQGMLWVVDRLT